MTHYVSSGLAAHLANTGSMKSALDGGFIDIYSGPVPADADAALGTATRLCRVSLDSTATGLTLVADGRFLRKNPGDSWTGTKEASGTATFYRHVEDGDDGSASTTAKRLQGAVGLTNAAEMTLVDVVFTAGGTFPLNNYVLEQPTYG
ncbi:hypothetical protein V8Z74_19655 [Comamonas sp. w2-DMI]|uniref:hypothetical protein n=1 Tax=Comamonas sp. w2-DMI TaxID=3126391 RepID=UPI0032E47B29